MATIPQPPPPPPPPPMPGTSGAFSMPNWRDNYQPTPPPIREKAPSKEQIDKQQYAHLPDKLLNTMNKDKKPFTYTPSGVSSEKGVLDLSEIRSPRMKKRLLANLHAGEEDEDGESYAAQQAKLPPSPATPSNQYSASALVLPPMPDSVQLRSPSPNSKDRKEVRFAPSPIPMLACDDQEMLKKLAARKADVEARATIVTNDPVGQDTVDNGPQQPAQHAFNNLNAPQPNFQESLEDVDVDQICKNAADAVREARGLIADNHLVDQNNNINNYEFSDDTMAGLNNDFKKMSFNQPDYVPQKHQHQPSYTNHNVGHQYHNQQSQPSVPNYNNTDVLKHVLDAGLQDEIDKFEEMGAKMGSTSPENYYNPPSHQNNHLPPPLPSRPINRPPPPPIPPRSNLNMMHQDGRTSCPPFNPNNQSEYQSDRDFMNSFRCISPAIEILKKTQNTGYNYVTKPRPFYRAVDEELMNQPNRMHVSSDDNFTVNTNERVIPIRMEDRNGYSATLPRKIKLNQADPRQPKSYDNTESGRQYLSQAGMFSQLPPRPMMEDQYLPESPGTPTQNKMFYGVNPKQPNQPQPNFRADNARSYVDPEIGRQYLPNAGMFSQLPPPPQSCLDGTFSGGQSEDDRYGFMKFSRQSSLPPPPSMQINHQNNYNNNNRCWTPGPQSSGTMPAARQQRLSLSELRKLPPSERPHEPPPMKYTGANIPSRSFRLLQLITGEDVPNQFVQEDDQQQQQQPQSRRARPPPPPVPPRSDSYRPASQQQQYFPNDPMMERCASVTPNMSATSTSSVYASSSLGTDF